jgi:hypothetical protein
MNLTLLSVNFTYNDNYQLAVYPGCSPCPPRYQCNFVQGTPFTCAYPSESDQKSYGHLCADCCACQNVLTGTPYWSATNTAIYPHLDNKHGIVTTTMTAMHDLDMLVCLELLHGQFYNEFEAEFAGTTVAYMHTPGRTSYAPGQGVGKRFSFFSMLLQGDFGVGLALPYNLPSSQVLAPKSATDSPAAIDRERLRST